MEQKRQDYGTASAFMMQLHSAVEAGSYETEKMAAGNHHGELTDHAAAEVAKAHHGSSTYKLDEEEPNGIYLRRADSRAVDQQWRVERDGMEHPPADKAQVGVISGTV